MEATGDDQMTRYPKRSRQEFDRSMARLMRLVRERVSWTIIDKFVVVYDSRMPEIFQRVIDTQYTVVPSGTGSMRGPSSPRFE